MITPMDIHNKTFSKKLRGYADDEVNSFLDEVASDYERIYREHREMEEQMDTLKAKLANYEKMEATMSSTLVMAQETAENVKTTAKKEAEVIVREGDMNLYIEKLLANFNSALSLIQAAKAARAPHVINDEATSVQSISEPVQIIAENTVEDSAIDVEEDLNSMETEETND